MDDAVHCPLGLCPTILYSGRVEGKAMEIPIRRGRDEDHDAILACVRAAYAKYAPRMGKEPAPMLTDYASLIAEGVVSGGSTVGPVTEENF